MLNDNETINEVHGWMTQVSVLKMKIPHKTHMAFGISGVLTRKALWRVADALDHMCGGLSLEGLARQQLLRMVGRRKFIVFQPRIMARAPSVAWACSLDATQSLSVNKRMTNEACCIFASVKPWLWLSQRFIKTVSAHRGPSQMRNNCIKCLVDGRFPKTELTTGSRIGKMEGNRMTTFQGPYLSLENCP